MRNRIVPIAAVLVLCVLMLTGCSSSGEKEEASSSLYVTMINTHVPMEAAETLQATLEQELPELISAGNGLIVNSVSSGDTEKDPMGAMAGMTQIAAMMSSGEMELVLMDSTNARRHGDNGSIYVPLDELFTAEEQAALNMVPVTLPMMDDEGSLTGETTAPCGVDLSGCSKITQLMYTNDVAAYVLIDSPHMEQAKDVIRWLLSAE